MKKFIKKMLIFAILITTITGCINYVYILRDKSDTQNIKKFQSIPSSIMVCNFGSSHGLYGFNYEDVKNVECFNFALSAQVPSYDERIFDYYKDNISEGAVIFIPVSYFSIYGNDERIEEGFANKNKRYYRILPSEMIKDYDLKTDIYVNYFPSLLAGENLIRTMIDGAEDTNEEIWLEQATDIDISEDARLAYERHIIQNKIDNAGNRIINLEEINALEYMINSCYEMGFTPILVTTPFMKEYTDEIKKNNPDFFDGFYSIIDKIVEDTGVSYYNYAFDDRFTEKYEWFMNSDHLNEEGARQFVNVLMDEIVHYGGSSSLIK